MYWSQNIVNKPFYTPYIPGHKFIIIYASLKQRGNSKLILLRLKLQTVQVEIDNLVYFRNPQISDGVKSK